MELRNVRSPFNLVEMGHLSRGHQSVMDCQQSLSGGRINATE